MGDSIKAGEASVVSMVISQLTPNVSKTRKKKMKKKRKEEQNKKLISWDFLLQW